MSLLLSVSFVWMISAADPSGYSAGDIIEYGSYPQSLVTDEEILAALPQLPGQHQSNCPCGQYHTGAFSGVIIFFHRIIYFFRNLFK